MTIIEKVVRKIPQKHHEEIPGTPLDLILCSFAGFAVALYVAVSYWDQENAWVGDLLATVFIVVVFGGVSLIFLYHGTMRYLSRFSRWYLRKLHRTRLTSFDTAFLKVAGIRY